MLNFAKSLISPLNWGKTRHNLVIAQRMSEEKSLIKPQKAKIRLTHRFTRHKAIFTRFRKMSRKIKEKGISGRIKQKTRLCLHETNRITPPLVLEINVIYIFTFMK